MNYPKAHLVKRPYRYTPSVATDIRKTFEAERRRLAREAKQQVQQRQVETA